MFCIVRYPGEERLRCESPRVVSVANQKPAIIAIIRVLSITDGEFLQDLVYDENCQDAWTVSQGKRVIAQLILSAFQEGMRCAKVNPEEGGE